MGPHLYIMWYFSSLGARFIYLILIGGGHFDGTCRDKSFPLINRFLLLFFLHTILNYNVSNLVKTAWNWLFRELDMWFFLLFSILLWNKMSHIFEKQLENKGFGELYRVGRMTRIGGFLFFSSVITFISVDCLCLYTEFN